MTDEKKKMTAHGSSVGADDGQSISQNSKITIPDPDEKSNSPERDLEELYRKMRRMSDPAYLHTVTLDELMDNVFEGKSAVIENLLYTGAYILAGAPKIGKSFLVAQIAHHVSTGQDLWEYKVHQGTVLYLALEDDESRLQRRMFRMFGVEGTSSLHFATSAKMIGSGLDEQLEKFVREHSDTKRRFWVEHNLLYPVIKGASDLKACQYNPQHELYAIVPNRGITSTWLSQAETEVEQNNRLLYDYFRAFEQQLRSRSTYRTRMPSAPYYAVYNVGGYTFAPWKVVWPEQPGNSGLPVAVVNTRTLQGVGEKIVVPDHKIYFAEFDDETTALYLCGLLTCSLVQKFIASFHIMIQVGDIFKHMRLPEFDERNHQHMHLVELVREAHNENDADVRNNLLTQISDIGNSIIETWTPTE